MKGSLREELENVGYKYAGIGLRKAVLFASPDGTYQIAVNERDKRYNVNNELPYPTYYGWIGMANPKRIGKLISDLSFLKNCLEKALPYIEETMRAFGYEKD